MPIHKTEAIVLNKRDFRETSLIVDLYSRDFGKIGGLLKGIRTEPGKFASNLETFSFNEVIFYHKRDSGLHLVTQCDLKDGFERVRASIDKITAASFMMELINAVMQPEDKNEQVFDLALNCLNELKTSPFPEKILTIFKIKMLTLSGFKPHFDSCISCDERILGQAKFSLSLGGLLCEQCQRRDLSSRSIFRGTIATILYIERSDFKTALN
ncbi:MAG: DNA repair protein RecO, partial [Candidatus Omnitrophica bacterium]|nr:DNA repair protein RecO [Candidatus Omnitrophota bacterium]